MRYRVLGPVEVEGDGVTLGVGGPQQRRLLGVLLVHFGQVVSADRLVDALWSEDSRPEGALRSVPTYVSRLRAVLGNGSIVAEGSGYRLDPADGERDTGRVRGVDHRSGSVASRSGDRLLRAGPGSVAGTRVRRVHRRVVGVGRVEAARGDATGGTRAACRGVDRDRPPEPGPSRPRRPQRRESVAGATGEPADASPSCHRSTGRSAARVPRVPATSGRRDRPRSVRRVGQVGPFDRRRRRVTDRQPAWSTASGVHPPCRPSGKVPSAACTRRPSRARTAGWRSR